MSIVRSPRLKSVGRCYLAAAVLGFVVVALPVTLQNPLRARAASIGTGFCASTVDNATGVTSTVAANGDCIVSFATDITTGGNAAYTLRNWTVPAGVTAVKVLVVAGGGGGGSSNSLRTGGAGGGGGVAVAPNYAVTPGATVVVITGAGGFGSNCGNGNKGGNSTFGSIGTYGGGGGSGCSAVEGIGGSGGGGHFRAGGRSNIYAVPTGVTAYGNAGGAAGTDYSTGGGGGGGGATEAGSPGTGAGANGTGGKGGEGIANSYRTDSPIIYGSGGGGGGYSVQGVGGTNGGNACGTNSSGVGGAHGVNETGGGGGGGWMNCTLGQPAGRGGSGIVVVRYGLPQLAAPTGVTVVATPGLAKSLDVSWSAVTNAQSYIVRVRGSGCGSIYGTKNVAGGTTTSTTVTRFDMSSFIMDDNSNYKVTVAAVGDGISYSTSTDAQCVSAVTNPAVAVPTISAQPASTNRTAGQDLNLSVTASVADAGSISYQWYQGGVAIPNATSSSYSIVSAASSDAGSYTVVVTNTFSGISISTTSSTATVAIATALTIATPVTGLSGTADSSYSLSAAASGGRSTLTYSLTGTLISGLSFNTSTGAISGTPSAAGTTTLSVSVTDANGATASTNNFDVVIAYASTSVTLSLSSSSLQYRTSVQITATTSRAGSVNFKLGGISIAGCESVAASSTTAVCSWVPVDLGTASLSAEFTPTTSTKYSNSTGSLSPLVQARALTVTPTSAQTKVFGGTDPTITYSITSGSLYGLDTLTGALSRVQGEDTGQYSITGGTLSNSNYAITVAPVNFVITQASQEPVTVTSLNGVYGAQLALTSSGGSGTGAVSFALSAAGTAGCSITSGSLTNTSPGTCSVIATRAASTNYFSASSSVTTISIAKAIQSTVTLTSISGTFNSNVSLTATGGSGSGAISFAVSDTGTAGCSVTGSATLVASSAGSCTVTATRTSDNYYESKSSTATLVTFVRDTQNALSILSTSGDLNSGITLSVSGGSGTGSVSFAVTSGSASCSITSGVVNARYVGSCTLTTTKAADTNYVQKQITNTLTFVKASQSALQVVTTNTSYGVPISLSTTGGSGTGAVTYSVTDVGSASCTVNGSLLTHTSAGTCKVTATRDGDGIFDARSSVATTITVERSAQPVLTLATTSGDLVTGIIVSISGGAGSGNLSTSVSAGSANCTLTSGVVTARSAGTCTFTISKASDNNYLSTSSTVTLTFSKVLVATGSVSSPTSGTVGTGITLAFSGGSGSGIVTYSLVSTGSAGCSITNGVLNASSKGKCSVVATKQGDDVYADQSVTSEFSFDDNSASASVNSSTTTTVVRALNVPVVNSTTTTSTTTTTTVPVKQVLPPSLVNTPSANGAATIGGKTVQATTTRVNNQLVFKAGGFVVTLAGVRSDGSVIPLTSDGLLEVRRGDLFRLDAQGFLPNSVVDIWMFSRSIHMSNIEVGEDGLVRSTLKVPKSLEDGLHHLVMVGIDRNSAEAKFEVGMNVGVPPKQWWYSRILLAIPIAMAVGFGLWLPTSSASRRRRKRTT